MPRVRESRGSLSPWPADLARGRMRVKHAALIEALTGRFDAHHAELARMLLDQIDPLSAQIARLTTRIEPVQTCACASWVNLAG
jgi:transposase